MKHDEISQSSRSLLRKKTCVTLLILMQRGRIITTKIEALIKLGTKRPFLHKIHYPYVLVGIINIYLVMLYIYVKLCCFNKANIILNLNIHGISTFWHGASWSRSKILMALRTYFATYLWAKKMTRLSQCL
mgnify:CR=1 FL=1